MNDFEQFSAPSLVLFNGLGMGAYYLEAVWMKESWRALEKALGWRKTVK